MQTVTFTAALSTLLTVLPAQSAGFMIRSGYSQNMITTDNQNSQQAVDNTLIFSNPLSDSIRGIMVVSTSKDLKNSEESFQIADTLLLAKKSIFENKIQNISVSGGLILPTSKDSHLRQELNFATRLEITDAIQIANLASWSFAGYLKMTQMNHRFETAKDGSLNTSLNLRQGGSAEYQIGKFAISGNIDHINSWKYTGKMSEAFETSQEISWEITKKVSSYFGHTNSGSVLKDNGTDSNIQLYNENQSMVFVGLNISL